MIDKAKRYLHHIQIKNKQRVINRLYDKEGLTEDVLKKQVEVNNLRHEHDIPDETSFVYEDFVQ